MTDNINLALELSKGVIKTCHCSLSPDTTNHGAAKYSNSVFLDRSSRAVHKLSKLKTLSTEKKMFF